MAMSSKRDSNVGLSSETLQAVDKNGACVVQHDGRYLVLHDASIDAIITSHVAQLHQAGNLRWVRGAKPIECVSGIGDVEIVLHHEGIGRDLLIFSFGKNKATAHVPRIFQLFVTSVWDQCGVVHGTFEYKGDEKQRVDQLEKLLSYLETMKA